MSQYWPTSFASLARAVSHLLMTMALIAATPVGRATAQATPSTESQEKKSIGRALLRFIEFAKANQQDFKSSAPKTPQQLAAFGAKWSPRVADLRSELSRLPLREPGPRKVHQGLVQMLDSYEQLFTAMSERLEETKLFALLDKTKRDFADFMQETRSLLDSDRAGAVGRNAARLPAGG